MADGFDGRKDAGPLRRATKAYVEALLVELLPPLRLAAKGCGYAIAVHGSLSRDIDLVAIPWTVGASKPEYLVDRLIGVIAGVLGRAVTLGDWSEMPHGRRALIITTTGPAEIDLSILPRVIAEKEDD